VQKIGSFAYPLAYVCVSVGAAVPAFMELLLAKLQAVSWLHCSCRLAACGSTCVLTGAGSVVCRCLCLVLYLAMTSAACGVWCLLRYPHVLLLPPPLLPLLLLLLLWSNTLQACPLLVPKYTMYSADMPKEEWFDACGYKEIEDPKTGKQRRENADEFVSRMTAMVSSLQRGGVFLQDAFTVELMVSDLRPSSGLETGGVCAQRCRQKAGVQVCLRIVLACTHLVCMAWALCVCCAQLCSTCMCTWLAVLADESVSRMTAMVGGLVFGHRRWRMRTRM
jgi:hypothetical protein